MSLSWKRRVTALRTLVAEAKKKGQELKQKAYAAAREVAALFDDNRFLKEGCDGNTKKRESIIAELIGEDVFGPLTVFELQDMANEFPDWDMWKDKPLRTIQYEAVSAQDKKRAAQRKATLLKMEGDGAPKTTGRKGKPDANAPPVAGNLEDAAEEISANEQEISLLEQFQKENSELRLKVAELQAQLAAEQNENASLRKTIYGMQLESVKRRKTG